MKNRITLLQDINFIKPINMISVDQFKQRKYKNGSIEKMVSLIDQIDRLPEGGYRCHLETGEILAVRPDGSFSKGTEKFKIKYDYRYSHKSGVLSIRPRSNNFGGYNCSMYTEKFFGICEQWLSGLLPTSFKNLTVNVKDGSGNLVTAEKLGIPFNMAPWNLEWCLADDNKWAGHKYTYLKRITGKVYSWSCNDKVFYQTIQHDDLDEIREYCRQNFKEVM